MIPIGRLDWILLAGVLAIVLKLGGAWIAGLVFLSILCVFALVGKTLIYWAQTLTRIHRR